MSDKKRKPESTQEESTIFSSHKSSADLRREQKEKKRLERQRLVDELTTQSSETRVVTRVMVIILALIVVGCAVVVYFQVRPDEETVGKEMASNSNHFTNFDALPELSEEGIKAVLTEVYYTQDGSLAVFLKLSNGMDTPQAVESFSFSLLNSSGDELASGHQADNWDASLVVPAGGYEELTLYVPPEDVKIKNDLLATLSLEITITSIPAGETTTG